MIRTGLGSLRGSFPLLPAKTFPARLTDVSLCYLPQCTRLFNVLFVIHLIYLNGEAILLDKQKNVISLAKNNLDKCYLSDISFSANDYALNSLLSLLPSKLIIHLISPADDFINTLQAIFGSSVSICTDCDICTIYKSLNKTKGSY